jgi:hypothetical protein
MAASKSFVVGNTVRFTNTVYVDDVLTDPTTVAFVVEEPDGTDQALTETNPGTGVYKSTFAPTQAGWHVVKFSGTGNSADYVRERAFYVSTSGMVTD